jgi:capsular exopolysaccharide synthesis family protein
MNSGFERPQLPAVQKTMMLMVDPGEQDTDSSTADPWRWTRAMLRRKGTIFAATLFGAFAGLLVLAPRTPLFRASTSVEVQALNEDFLYSKDVSPNSSLTAGYPEIDLQTQTTILKTRQLRDLAVAKLKADPAFQVRIPEDRFAKWRKALHLPARPEQNRDDVIDQTAATVDAAPTRTTRVIVITCESPDPALAAAFVNAMASEYIEQSLDKKWQSARYTGEWLSRQLNEMKVKLEKSEDEMQGYAAAVSLAAVTGDADKGKTSASGEKLRQLQTELSSAQGDRVSKQARYELVSSGKPDSLGPVLEDATIRGYDTKLADLRRELANLTTTLTPAHYKVSQVEAQIAELESDRSKFRDRIVEHIYNEYLEAQRRENLLADAWQAQAKLVYADAGKLAHYNILEREVDTDRQMYQGLLQKVKEAGISAALRASNIQVIDPASRPLVARSPNFRQGILIGLIAGFFGGIGLVLVRDNMNRHLEMPADISWYLKLPVLGAIPARMLGLGRWRGVHLVHRKAASQDIVGGFQSVESLQMTEAFRSVLTSILFIGRKRPTQVLVVTSPGRAEGKTTVSCNLGLACAEANRSVLIIDCDVRLPRLHDLFNVPREPGLIGLLSEKEALTQERFEASLSSAAAPGLTVLASGYAGASAENLLHSPRFPELVALARQRFDMVLIDTPPCLQFADARIAGSLADGLVLVARSGQTQRDSAIAASQQLSEDGIPIVGVVLNDWNPKRSGFYGYEPYMNSYEDYRKPANRIAVGE